MELSNDPSIVMNLESKRIAIAKSLLKTDPIVKPIKFKKFQNKFDQFEKNQRKEDEEFSLSFKSWYVLMHMPCECDETKIWDLNVLPNVSVSKIDESLPMSEDNAQRRCKRCQQR